MSGPSITSLIAEIGAVGVRMTEIDAAEGAAGNISVFLRDLDSPPDYAGERRVIDLPLAAPALAGGWLLVTGAGRRLRDVGTTPATTLCWLHIHEHGQQAALFVGSDIRPTSELNSHLAVHNDQVARRGLSRHVVLHAQPPYLTYLSHIERYGDTTALNRRLLRWQAETIIEFPEGIAMLPFEVPSSPEQAQATMCAMRYHRAVVWQRHGIVTRTDGSISKAGDLVEYAEAAARYEYLNLQSGEPSGGLSDDQMRLICERLGVEQSIF
ncbi:MAG TPA: class II aldolase/adducin family protein [Herpetosiphonaceae bacterium]